MISRRQAIKTTALTGFALAALPGVFAEAERSTSDDVKVSKAELAGQILADSTLGQTLRMAQNLLKTGVNAGSGYQQTWIRDMNTFITVALAVNPPQRFREALVTFFKFQGPKGDSVDGFNVRTPARVKAAYRLTPLAPDLAAFKNTVEVDQESSLVQAVSKYIAATNDRSLLDERVAGVAVRERLSEALGYLLTERFDKEHGLVWGATRADWGDVQPESPLGVRLDASTHRALCIYDNAMFLIAINDYLQLVEGDGRETRRWKSVRDALRRNIRKYLWDEKRQKFIPHVYLDGSPFPKDFDENAIFYHGGTAVAIEAGVLSRREILHSIEHMEADVRAAGAATIGLTLYPPYPEGFFKNPQMREPYSYQNGGDWSWFGGRMIQQLVRTGFPAEAYRNLQPMVERVVRTGDFHEWWTRDNQPRGSAGFRGSAGVLGEAIEMLQAWAQQTAAH